MAGQGRRGLRAAAPRDLRTVLFTDIVGSTEVAARLGDRANGALLARARRALAGPYALG
ncbi:MAG: hypothetical protein ACLQBX_01425 [Candidatus Limnocylindrales bacterium]|jgi:class 3 adenylate cyclase